MTSETVTTPKPCEISPETEELLKKILSKIQQDYSDNTVSPQTLFEFQFYIKQLNDSKIKSQIIYDSITDDHIYLFRTLLTQQKNIIPLILNILQLNIEICPKFTNFLLNCMLPIVICKILEDPKNEFQERYECIKLIYIWLKYSDENFPIIFCQSIAAMARSDEIFRKGCVEFLRNLAMMRPDLCSTIGGFRILINALLDEKLNDLYNNVFFALLHVINSPTKRKYFNGFNDFYKIFAVFTKSDFCLESNSKDKENAKDKKNDKEEEKQKLEKQLRNSKKTIIRLIKTWPGYSLIMNDYLAMGSVVDSLNTDTNLTIKSSVLTMFKEILEDGFNFLDNFTIISSQSKDEFYINKIFLAYILNSLQNNHFYENLIKFILDEKNISLSEYAKKLLLKYSILYSKLSNTDLQLPLLDEKLEKEKIENDSNNNFNINMNLIGMNNNFTNMDDENKITEFDEEAAKMKVMIMHLLDQTFYHFNCKDDATININNLSTEIIIATHTTISDQNIKTYENQYYIDSCKKELFSRDDEQYNLIIKNSKVCEVKEYTQWDWRYIDSILDLVDTCREYISDLQKKKFFKNILLCYMPSKNTITKNSWSLGNFCYNAIGNKLFKLISTCNDLENILDSPPEDYIMKKNTTWLEDIMQSIEGLLANSAEENPFSFNKVYYTLSRSIFGFIGILSQTQLGDDYLQKKKFYALLERLINSNGQFDYILIPLIDNLNLNSNYVISWVLKLIANGSKKIKRYFFEHMRCLLKFGKDTKLQMEVLVKTFDEQNTQNEYNKIILDIFKLSFFDGRNLDQFSHNRGLLEKLKNYEGDKTLLYVLMRNQKSFEFLNEYIDKELNSMDLDKVIEQYGNEIEKSMLDVFNYEENKEQNENYYLNINLAKIENQYDNFFEFFFIKQLPIHVYLKMNSIDNKEKQEESEFNSFMEYHDANNIILYSEPRKLTSFNIKKQYLQFSCMLGKFFIDNKNCKTTTDDSGIIEVTSDDFNKVEKIPQNNNDELFTVNKKGVIIVIKTNNKEKGIYTLISISIPVKINPSVVKTMHTPINIITELNNTKSGYKKLSEFKIIDKLLGYLNKDNLDNQNKKIKSALWILAKLLIKEKFGEQLQNQYKIIEKIIEFNHECKDYAMKGSIIYVLSYISQNKNFKNILESLNYKYFFSTDICCPNDIDEIFMDNSTTFINKTLNEENDKINRLIVLNETSQDIYNNVSGLINSITYNQSMQELSEVNKNDNNSFIDTNLFIKIYCILSKFKFKQVNRRNIMSLFEKAIYSNQIAKDVSKIFKNIGGNIFTAHEFKK